MQDHTFQEIYCELIETYQYIEHDLEVLYASITNVNFFDSLDDVDKDSLHKILLKVRSLDINGEFLTDSLMEKLEELNSRRNFYVHNFF